MPIDIRKHALKRGKEGMKTIHTFQPELLESDELPCGFDYGDEECATCSYEVCLNKVATRTHITLA